MERGIKRGGEREERGETLRGIVRRGDKREESRGGERERRGERS